VVIGCAYVTGTKNYTTYMDAIRLTPKTAPTSPEKGTIYMDDATSKLMCFDGTVWQPLW
jgi:hypothetical protein